MAKPINIIKKIITLSNIPKSGSDIIGISDLNEIMFIKKRDVIASRGEFAGYLIEKNKVILFRDRLGGRNIFYSIKGGKLYISTDLAWLFKQVKAEPNWEHILSDYLQFQIPFSDETFFSDIKRVMPAEFVTIDKQQVQRQKYWEIKFGNSVFDPCHLLKLIRDAVEFRLSLINSRRYTSYLSGGIDSSSVTLLSKPSECFSGFYDEEDYSEMDYIESVVSKSKLLKRYRSIQITERKFQRYLRRIPEILKEPSCGLGVIPQVMVAEKAAKNGYRYSFSGEGGDEVFLGYNWNTIVFQFVKAARDLLSNKYMVRYEPMVEKVLKDAFPGFMGGLLSRGNDKLYATKRILDIWNPNESVENNILKFNLTVTLPAILTVDEYVGKYSSVTPISPLIDHKIAEYVCSIKPQDRASIPKFMIREALKGILPEKVRARYDKMGFPVPYQKWNWDIIKPVIKSFAKRKLIDVDITKHRVMDRKTWALYNIEVWYKHYFENS